MEVPLDKHFSRNTIKLVTYWTKPPWNNFGWGLWEAEWIIPVEVGAFPLAQPQTPLPAPRAGKPTPRAAICFTSHQRADGALPSGVRRDFNPPPAPHRLLCIFCGYFPATKGTILLRREVGEEKHLLKHFFIPFPSMNWGPSSMRLEKKIKTLLKSPYFHDNDLFCVKVCRLHTERSAALCSQHHGQPLIRRERRGRSLSAQFPPWPPSSIHTRLVPVTGSPHLLLRTEILLFPKRFLRPVGHTKHTCSTWLGFVLLSGSLCCWVPVGCSPRPTSHWVSGLPDPWTYIYPRHALYLWTV